MLSKEEAVLEAKDMVNKTQLIEVFSKKCIHTIYVAGSILEGFGNSKSDVDIFVLLESTFDKEGIRRYIERNDEITYYDRGSKLVFVLTHNNINFDIEVYEKDFIFSYIDVINKKIPSTQDLRYDFFHRIKFAQPIFKEKNMTRLLAEINYNLYNSLLPRELSFHYSTKVTDIHGAFIEEEFATAFKMALYLLEDCISSFLSLHGETNPNRKWLMKKIKGYSMNTENHINLFEILNRAYAGVHLENKKMLKIKTIEILKDCQFLNYECEKYLSEVD